MTLPLDANARFARCDAFVEGPNIEGGFVDNPNDPGGATDHGVTLATLSLYRGHPCSVDELKALTPADRSALYRALYWAAIGGDGLPPGVDLIVYDAAVNQGPGTAAAFLQVALGVEVDRHIGPLTLAAAAKAAPVTLVTKISDERMHAYRQSSGWEVFGKGWTDRLSRTEDQATAWAAGGA